MDEIMEILKFMLVINPKHRPNAEQVLAHKFFNEMPERITLPFEVEENEEEIKLGVKRAAVTKTE